MKTEEVIANKIKALSNADALGVMYSEYFANAIDVIESKKKHMNMGNLL